MSGPRRSCLIVSAYIRVKLLSFTKALKPYDISALSFGVIDDNDFMCRVVVSVLRSLGVRRIYASNHADAIEKVGRFSPEIIFYDYGLGRSNELDLVIQIRRSQTPFNPATAIILTSAISSSDHIKRARDVGIDHFLIKPLSPKLLYKNIVRCIESTKPFIKIQSYIGPDRRSRGTNAGVPVTPNRRKTL